MVVMATGLGKTFLAAFDSECMSAARLLFVAHREEILLQAESSFQLVQPGRRVGRYTGERRDADLDLLFASVQTLGQSRHLELFAADHFDYVVVDEFHHAAAPTYRRLLGHFRPRFLLGLTASNPRANGSVGHPESVRRQPGLHPQPVRRGHVGAAVPVPLFRHLRRDGRLSGHSLAQRSL
ncbi:hypothetical protein THIOKS1600014 [Thiocapsa sp. KS1]|nr:hypothetical protein THIOKS1600014 [Thiocapsa sp. KS1]